MFFFINRVIILPCSCCTFLLQVSCPWMSMMVAHASSCRMSLQHVHASCPGYMFMLKYPCFMSMLHVLVIWPAAYPCCMSMIHLYVHAECLCNMSLQNVLSMLHIHSTFPLFILQVQAAVYAACPYCMSILHVHAVYPWHISLLYCMSLVHAHVNASCIYCKSCPCPCPCCMSLRWKWILEAKLNKNFKKNNAKRSKITFVSFALTWYEKLQNEAKRSENIGLFVSLNSNCTRQVKSWPHRLWPHMVEKLLSTFFLNTYSWRNLLQVLFHFIWNIIKWRFDIHFN